ncbi:MAG: spermidine synthase [bacterium]
MIGWENLASAPACEGGRPLSLHRRGDEYVIRAGGVALMSSRQSGSEVALARLARRALEADPATEGGLSARRCDATAQDGARRVLVGGLGMGFTAAAALEAFPDARIVVAEIEAHVVDWNRRWLAPLAGSPLDDPRLEVVVEDVHALVGSAAREPDGLRFDAILLDVDNGPEALSRRSNERLYAPEGIASAARALRSGGVLAIWSAGPDASFGKRLARLGGELQTHRVSPRAGSRGRARHTIWLARPA